MEASHLPLVELLDRWGIANAERMMVRADQLQLRALLSRKGNSGEVWRGALWGKEVRGCVEGCAFFGVGGGGSGGGGLKRGTRAAGRLLPGAAAATLPKTPRASVPSTNRSP